MGELQQRRITATLGGITGSTQSSVTTGGFSFDEPTMRSIITRYTTLADSYDQSLLEAERIAGRVEGPGLEYASRGVAGAANQGLQSYVDYLTHQRDECRNQTQLFQAALDEYLGVDQTAAEDIDTSGDSGSGDTGGGIL